jgi:hypothetical protein
MSDLQIEIFDMLADGETPSYIARVLDIPISWVYEAMSMNEDTDYSPYCTINS